MKATHDPVLEKTLLGYVIYDKKSFALVKPIIDSVHFFTSPAHRAIFTALLDLDEGDEWDTMIIGDELKKNGRLCDVGGYGYLAKLVDMAPGKCNVVYYANILKESHLSVQVCKTAQLLIDEMSKPDDGKERTSFNNVMAGHIQKIRSYQSSLGARQNKVRLITEIMPAIWKRMEEVGKDGVRPAMSTGFRDLDTLFGGGIYPSKFNILAGRPSAGKTSLAVNMVINNSPHMDTLLISLETTGESLARDLFLPVVSGVDSTTIRMGELSKSEWMEMGSAFDKISKYRNLKICDQAVMSIGDIELLVSSEVESAEGKLKFLIIDYAQLIQNPGKFGSREERMADVSRRLKALYKHYNLMGIVIVQLNRASEKEKREPIMSDLRESGQFEQDADTITFLYQTQKDIEEKNDRVLAKMAKNKSGPIGTAEFNFNRKITKFETLDRVGG